MPLHPHIKVSRSAIAGRGLIAQKRIPRGTIIWHFSEEEVRRYSTSQYRKFSVRFREMLRRYAYTDYSGEIIYTLSDTKFFNHSCDANTTDALCEEVAVAIRNIEPGEEVTYDYGILMGPWEPPLKCACGAKNCRASIVPLKHNSKMFKALMSKARSALKQMKKVKQPMLQNTKSRKYILSALP